MQLVPYHTFTLTTDQPLSKVIGNLETHVEAPKMFRWSFSRDHKPYEGSISESGFELRRIIHYRNSFLPKIQGHFDSSSQETVIRITMGLHPFIKVFLLFWLSLWYSISTPVFLPRVFAGEASWESLLFLGLPLVVLVGFWCAFWYEATRSHRELTQIFLGQPLDPHPAGLPSPILLRILFIGAILLGNAIIVFYLLS